MKDMQKHFLSTGLSGVTANLAYLGPLDPDEKSSYQKWKEDIYKVAGYTTLCSTNPRNPEPRPSYSAPLSASGVVTPNYDAQRIFAAQAKRERKARKRSIHQ